MRSTLACEIDTDFAAIVAPNIHQIAYRVFQDIVSLGIYIEPAQTRW